MTISDLYNIRYQAIEVEKWRLRVEELETAITKITSSITGMPKGGSGESDLAEDLIEARNLLNDHIVSLETSRSMALDFILECPDSLIRTALEMRFLEGKRWLEISQSLNNTDDNVRKMVWRYLNRNLD